MTVRGYVLIECDQTRVLELKESLSLIELDGSRITAIDAVAQMWLDRLGEPVGHIRGDASPTASAPKRR